MAAGCTSSKAIKLKGEILHNHLQKYYVLSGLPCKNFWIRPSATSLWPDKSRTFERKFANLPTLHNYENTTIGIPAKW